MSWRTLAEDDERTFALAFEGDDEVLGELRAFARAQGIEAASFSGTGALQRVRLGSSEWGSGYEEILIDDRVEILSRAGDLRLLNDAASAHAELVAETEDGSWWCGPMLAAAASHTLRLVVVESTRRLRHAVSVQTNRRRPSLVEPVPAVVRHGRVRALLGGLKTRLAA